MPNIQAHLNFANRRGIMNMNLSKSDKKSGPDILELSNISWMRHMLVGRLKKNKRLDDLNNDGFFNRGIHISSTSTKCHAFWGELN